jgi:hypothetical protein
MAYITSLYPLNTANISRQIWEMGEAYRNACYEGRKKGKTPVELVKAFYFTYLSASNISDLLSAPYPRMEVQAFRNWILIKVVKQSKKDKTGIQMQFIPLDDEYEKEMWDLVLDCGETMSLDTLALSFGGIKARTHITNRFKRSFRMTLTDGTVTFRNRGITPDFLRTLREYVLLKKGYSIEYVRGFMGLKRIAKPSKGWIGNEIKQASQLTQIEKVLDKERANGIMSYRLGN